MRIPVVLAATAAAATVLALAGCDAASTPARHQAAPSCPDIGCLDRRAAVSAAVAYLQAHPAAARPGMAAGIVADDGEQLWACPSPAASATLPAVVSRAGEAIGGPPYTCGATWFLDVITGGGQALTVTCGNVDAKVGCAPLYSTRTVEDLMGLSPGDYLYFPADGKVVSASDIQLIRRRAVRP